jgi:hypothetical protein
MIAHPGEPTPVLIDFGRSQTEKVGDVWADKDRFTWDTSAVMFARSEDVRSQDIYDYGCLIMDLVQQWMAATSRTTLPAFLVDLITRCVCEGRQPMMREIVDIWERHAVATVAGVTQQPFVDADDAWGKLALSTKSKYSTTRSRPSAPMFWRKCRQISIDTLDSGTL